MAPARISEKIGRDANQFMFCRPQSGNTLESKGGVEMRETILLGLSWIPQNETPSTKERSSTELRCASFVARLCSGVESWLSRVKMNAKKRRP